MTTLIHIKSLGVPTVTRPRGREAAEELILRYPQGEIDLQLDNLDMLSMSFLDEVAIALSSGGNLDRVTFVAQDRDVWDKLAKVAALRTLTLHLKESPSTPPTTVEPAAPCDDDILPE